MMSSSDLPACPACGIRTVRSVRRPVADRREAHSRDAPIRHPDEVITAQIMTFYACSQCGKDRTEAWEAIQPPPPPEKAGGAT